jgi:hypothetical protein
MKHFNFWQKWLLIVSLYLVIFGLVLAFFNQSQLMDLVFNNQIDPAFWPGGNIPENAALFQAWVYGVLGATVSGWGILMAFVVGYPFKARQKWAWNCLAAALTIWFIADTAISAYFQVIFNVVFNTALFLLIGIPLLFTRSVFLNKSNNIASRAEFEKNRQIRETEC